MNDDPSFLHGFVKLFFFVVVKTKKLFFWAGLVCCSRPCHDVSWTDIFVLYRYRLLSVQILLGLHPSKLLKVSLVCKTSG